MHNRASPQPTTVASSRKVAIAAVRRLTPSPHNSAANRKLASPACPRARRKGIDAVEIKNFARHAAIFNPPAPNLARHAAIFNASDQNFVGPNFHPPPRLE